MTKYISYVSTLAILAAFLGGTAMAAELKVGDKAPAFELPGSDGKTYKLAELNKQKKVVVVAWFPKAFTPG